MKVLIINCTSIGSSITKENIEYVNTLSKTTDVLIILKDQPEFHKYNLFDNKVQTKFIKIPRFAHPSNITTLFNIMKTIKKFKPDVIDIRCGYPWLSLLFPYFRRYKTVATFFTAKPRNGEKDRLHYRIGQYCFRNFTDGIVVFDQYSKDVFVSDFHISAKKLHIITAGDYSGVYEKMSVEIPVTETHEKYILFLGRIVEYKGLEYLIKAEPLITKEVPNAKIVIAGGCENFEKYESLIKNKNSFELHIEWVSDEMAIQLFKKSSVIVFPYTEFSRSGNIHLAYSFKKPIVASEFESMKEYVIDGKTGILVPPKNIEELSNAIIKILKDDQLAKEMGQNGYKFARNTLSWDNIVKDALLVYENVLNPSY